MSFEVPRDAYDRFMGRYAEPLAPVFAEQAGVLPGMKVLDVGCGPGGLTAHLVGITGAANVAAVDPSPPFLAATARRCPGVDVQPGVAEELPHADATFDASLAQLVVHFMTDPVAGLREMARVTRPGGTVAACVWDFVSGGSPIAPFWDVVHAIDPDAAGESGLPGAHEGHLIELITAAGLEDVEGSMISVDVVHPTFEDWWEPYTFGVGPAGDYVRSLSASRLEELVAACRDRFREAPFTIHAAAWSVTGTVA